MNWNATNHDINNIAIEILDILRSEILSGNRYHINLSISKTEESVNYYRGDILQVDFGEGLGYENEGLSEVIVVQNNNGNKFANTLIVTPIIKHSKGRIATDIECYGYVFKTNRTTVVDKSRVIKKVSSLNLNMSQIIDGILYNLGILSFNKFNSNGVKLDYKRGDVVYVDLGTTVGSEQSGIRPCLILQNDIGNHFGTTTVIIPFTEKTKKELPTHYSYPRILNGGNESSTLLFEQIRMVDKSRILSKVDFIELDKIDEIKEILTDVLFS